MYCPGVGAAFPKLQRDWLSNVQSVLFDLDGLAACAGAIEAAKPASADVAGIVAAARRAAVTAAGVACVITLTATGLDKPGVAAGEEAGLGESLRQVVWEHAC